MLHYHSISPLFLSSALSLSLHLPHSFSRVTFSPRVFFYLFFNHQILSFPLVFTISTHVPSSVSSTRNGHLGVGWRTPGSLAAKGLHHQSFSSQSRTIGFQFWILCILNYCRDIAGRNPRSPPTNTSVDLSTCMIIKPDV